MRANSGYERLPSGLFAPNHVAQRSREIDELERAGIPRRVAIAAGIQGVLAGDSILVTPGSGATVATHTANSKEHQVVMVAEADGHLVNSKDDWFAWFAPATNAANRSVADLFNADAAVIVRVRGIWCVPTVTAVTGANVEFIVNITSAVGTGGTTITPRPLDPNFAALDADITARAGATGGATLDYEMFRQYHLNEETNASTALIQHQNLLPSSIGNRVAEIVLRQNDGVQLKQGGANTVGLTGCLIYFTVE